MSKACFERFCLFPSIKFEKHFIRTINVFSLNCITPEPTFWIKAYKSFKANSATDAFLSRQCSAVIDKLTSYPQLHENEVNTSWADVFMYPMSVDAFLMRMGKNTTTAFYTLTCWPASNHSLTNLKIFFTRRVFPVDNNSKIVWENLSIISGTYSGWNLFIFLNSVIQLKLSVQLWPLIYDSIKVPLFWRSLMLGNSSKVSYWT